MGNSGHTCHMSRTPRTLIVDFWSVSPLRYAKETEKYFYFFNGKRAEDWFSAQAEGGFYARPISSAIYCQLWIIGISWHKAVQILNSSWRCSCVVSNTWKHKLRYFVPKSVLLLFTIVWQTMFVPKQFCQDLRAFRVKKKFAKKLVLWETGKNNKYEGGFAVFNINKHL